MLKHACRRPLLRGAFQRCPPGCRPYASVTDLQNWPEPGAQISGFTLQHKKHVPELHLTALHLQHDKTGAQYLHVARDDTNNVFAINFKTNPIDRTGLPHILEHVTLCGSHKFPVRDPFFKMMPRSLANFMNAFTAADYTSYPFATTNPQDFRNLADVYLDATLHPLLKKTDFLQEGWRLGPEDPREPATEDNVKFKGVVYNEMKGQMSDSSYLFYIRFREHLFPALENSGGDPDKMTDLHYDNLVKFSRQHYHPSNAKIFTYGNMDLDDHVRQIDAALSRFDHIATDTDLKGPIDLTSPVAHTVHGPIDTMQPPDRQVKSSVTWLGCPASDIVENFAISIMTSLLMNGYGSPLYQGLIEAGLGSNFSPNTGYDASAKLGVITIGLDGMSAEDAEQLKSSIQAILRQSGSDAFQQHKVDGYMHQLEMALKHKTANFGMGLLDKTLPAWLNGVSPMDGLSWNDTINAFQKRMQKPGYLQSLMEKYLFTDNAMHFTMLPSDSYNTALEQREQDRRRAILDKQIVSAGSSEAVFSTLGQQELQLLHEQETSQQSNLDSLPTLRVQDIPTAKERKPITWQKLGAVDCLWRQTDTNGITYFQAKHLFNDLPDHLRLLLPLFTESLMRLGTKTKSVGDLEAEILLKTGGISISPFTSPDAFDTTMYSEGLMLDGYALDRNVPAMLELVRTILQDVDFSAPHVAPALLELLQSKTAGALDSVAETGHQYALSAAAAALSARGWKQDQLAGLSQIEATSKLLSDVRNEDKMQSLVQNLRQIQSIAISNSAHLSLRMVCEPSSVDANQASLRSFMHQLPTGTPTSRSSTVSNSSFSRNTFFNLPFQVSYTGTCLQTVPYASPDKAPLTILGQLLTHNFLHPEVREKGGAYGASTSASPISSLFTMSSYRDPNPRNSLNTFSRAGKFARDREWTDRELEESKLSVFQQVDAPTSVSSDGIKELMYGISQDMDQQMRERLLSVTAQDVQRVADQYLVSPKDQSTVILGEKKDWIDDKWQVKSMSV